MCCQKSIILNIDCTTRGRIRSYLRAIRITSFADFREHSTPLFSALNLLKFNDIVKFQTVTFMHDFSQGNLPPSFDSFFLSISNRHKYNTRLASCKLNYSLPSVRTNYGKFNIRFSATKAWNSLDENVRTFKKTKFKKHIFSEIINSYNE